MISKYNMLLFYLLDVYRSNMKVYIVILSYIILVCLFFMLYMNMFLFIEFFFIYYLWAGSVYLSGGVVCYWYFNLFINEVRLYY